MLVGTQLYIQPGDLAPWEEPRAAHPGPQVQPKKQGLPGPVAPQQDPEDAITPNATIARKSSRLLARIGRPDQEDQPNARKAGRPRGSKNKDAEAKRATASAHTAELKQARLEAAEKKELAAAQKMNKEKLKDEKKKEDLEGMHRDLFLTYVQKRGDIDNPGAMQKTQDSFDQTPEIKKSFAGQERGPRMRNLHEHLVVHTVGLEAGQLTKKFKQFLGLQKKPGISVETITLKGKGIHTFYGIMGYSMKSMDQAEFRCAMKNIVERDVETAWEEYLRKAAMTI